MPDGLDTFAKVVKNMAALNTATGGKETADDAGDVTANVEGFRVVHTNALYTKAETSDAGQYHGLAVAQFLLHGVL